VDPQVNLMSRLLESSSVAVLIRYFSTYSPHFYGEEALSPGNPKVPESQNGAISKDIQSVVGKVDRSPEGSRLYSAGSFILNE
jgi:hypothetical protein